MYILVIMYTCHQCGQKTLKFNKGETALYVNIVPDTNNRPNYKEQYTTVKILGNKCYAHFDWNSEGKSTERKEKAHDYVCQPNNSKNTFPAHEDQLYKMEDGNVTLKNLLTKK